ncbi:O-antigen ligase family protein, partial [Candidatus Kaiserbacteria bacterium]|nr:O-antigen ligase family protein [Candidatus Kaiserbacteria bacterium]
MMIGEALRWVVLTGIFSLPFIVFYVAESLFFPFITGKNFTFRIIVEVIAGAYLALALVNPSYRPRRSWLLGAFALFVVIVAAADMFGVYPLKSFWSNYERMDGWVALAHLFLYFVVISSVLNTEKLWRAFWHLSLAVSALVGVYGLLQLIGVLSLNPGFSSVSRIDATFGNPIYLAVYMLFNIGIAASLWSRAWQEDRMGRTRWSLIYGGLIVLDTLVLFLTGTRGTMLGLIGGVLLGAVLVAWSSREARRIALSTIVLIALLGGGLFLARDQAWIQRVPVMNRLATISLEDGTTMARFMNWGMAWEGLKERPFLGWGQENYAIVFDKYYNPQMYG